MAESDSDSDYEEQGSVVLPVSQVIKPLAPNDIDYNNWPCYLLEDAVVFDKHGAYTSLLDVSTKGPLTIEGRLNFEGEDELLSNLTNLSLKSAFIRVEGVAQFSFGSRDNSADTGHVCMWGGEGRHGWFEIDPAEAYEATYSKSAEAVNIYHFVSSLYSRKGASTLLIQDVLHGYASREGSGRTRREVEVTIKGHAEFLLNQMLLKEGVNFPKTVFFNWLAKSRPDVVAELAKRKVNITISANVPNTTSVPILPPPVFDKNQAEPEPYEPVEGEEQPELYRPSPSDNPNVYISSGDQTTSTNSLPEPPSTDVPRYIAWYLEITRHNPHSKHATYFRKGLPNLTIRNCSNLLYTDLTFKKYFTAIELLKLHAPAIRAALPPAWHVSTLYSDLAHPSTIPSKGPEFVAAAREITFLKRRQATQAPRGPVGETGRKERKTKQPREKSPGGTLSQHFASSSRLSSSSRHVTPSTGAPISNRRSQNTTHRPAPAPQVAMTKAQMVLREAETNRAKTSGEGVTPPPRGKLPARKPITIQLSSSSSDPRVNPRKRSYPDEDDDDDDDDKEEEEQPPLANNRQPLPSPSASPGSSSSPSTSNSNSNEEAEPKEAIRLTLTSTPLPPPSTSSFSSSFNPHRKPSTHPKLGRKDEAAANILASETMLTGHAAPFLQQLIAEGRERFKEREMVGEKVVKPPIRGLMRGDEW